MRQAIFFICEVCNFANENAEAIAKHEVLCQERKAKEEQELAHRQATGQLTIAQILQKCNNLPNLPVVINSKTAPQYHGKFPNGTHSYRGYYDELSIDVGDKVISLHDFQIDMTRSLHVTYSGYKGGEYSMNDDTFVWLSKYGVASGVIVTNISIAPSGKVINLSARLED